MLSPNSCIFFIALLLLNFPLFAQKSGVLPQEKSGLKVSIINTVPEGNEVIIKQPLGRKGPTSIRYLPLHERELKDVINPADAPRKYYYVKDRDMGQTFTIPKGKSVSLKSIVLRVGPVTADSIKSCEGAKVSMQLFKVSGRPQIMDNGTTLAGTTVSKGYPGQCMADDYIIGEKYKSILIAGGAILPQNLKTGKNNTGAPTPESEGSLLKFDFAELPKITLKAENTYAFLLCFDEPSPGRGLPLDNWDYINMPEADSLEKYFGPYKQGHAIRREGAVEFPWLNTDSVFSINKLQSHFPQRNTRMKMSPSTWGRPDVDTWRDLTFWIITQ